jgi:hypothetical protein
MRVPGKHALLPETDFETEIVMVRPILSLMTAGGSGGV